MLVEKKDERYQTDTGLNHLSHDKTAVIPDMKQKYIVKEDTLCENTGNIYLCVLVHIRTEIWNIWFKLYLNIFLFFWQYVMHISIFMYLFWNGLE